MYAVIATDGRQYKVAEGQEIEIDYREVAKGSQLKFDQVLAVSGPSGAKIGAPTVAGASVTAEVLGTKLGEKLFIQKFRKRENYRRRTGHRQVYTTVKITKINA